MSYLVDMGVILLLAYGIRQAVQTVRYVGAMERFYYTHDPIGYRMLCDKLGVKLPKKYK